MSEYCERRFSYAFVPVIFCLLYMTQLETVDTLSSIVGLEANVKL
jgi:hypothetical protein